MAAECLRIARLPDEGRFRAYAEFADSLLAKQDAEGMTALVQHVITKEGATQFGRTYIVGDLVQMLCDKLVDEEQKYDVNLNVDDVVPIMKLALSLLHVDSFPEAYLSAVKALALAYQGLEDWTQAAATRSSVSTNQLAQYLSMDAESRVKWQITTAELYLKAGAVNAGQAYVALQRSLPDLSETKDGETRTRHQLVYARVVDQLSRFGEAAARYCDLADSPTSPLLTEARKAAALMSAVTCAVLAPIGPARSRILTKLYADGRARRSPLYEYLCRLLTLRVLSSQDLAVLQACAQPHMLAVSSGGRSRVQQSWIEHNILAASQVYSEISLQAVGDLVGCSAEDAEGLVAGLITSSQLSGARIDQTTGYVEFARVSPSAAAAAAAGASASGVAGAGASGAGTGAGAGAGAGAGPAAAKPAGGAGAGAGGAGTAAFAASASAHAQAERDKQVATLCAELTRVCDDIARHRAAHHAHALSPSPPPASAKRPKR